MLDFQAARWLRCTRSPKQAGNDHPTSDPDRRVQDHGRPHQHRHRRQVIWERFCQALGAPELLDSPRLQERRAALEEPRRAQRRDRQAHATRPARNGSTSSTRPACRAARSTTSTRCSPIRRSSISASRRSVKAGRQRSIASSASRSRCRARRARSPRAPPELGQHTDEVLEGVRLRRRRNRGAAQGQGDLTRIDRARPHAGA